MAETIQQIFCDPPISIARLGGSSTPLDAYVWNEPANPRADGDTIIMPAWSLRVNVDGSFQPVMPDSITFRDGDAIRPVCPFVELHAWLGEPGSGPNTWREAPLTPDLLSRFGATISAITLTVTAMNRKAARRRRDHDLVFGTFPPVVVQGDQTAFVPLRGISPPNAARAMIPLGRHIPLGGIQMLESMPPPTSGTPAWEGIVDTSVLRFRVTPAQGLFYGPPRAARPTSESPVPAVEPANAFLDPDAGWFNQSGDGGGFVQPGDTYDMVRPESQQEPTPPSLGVVDDTCEIRVEVTLTLPNAASLNAHASVFVAPPDFAPDRRPFLSLADELNDRSAARVGPPGGEQLDDWVEDLFERIYETASMMNVDFWRATRGLPGLTGTRLAGTAVPEDHVAPPDQAMGSLDALRDRDFPIAAPSTDVPLPLSEHARSRHRTLSGIAELRDLVARQPDRLKTLIRQPFEVDDGEQGGDVTTMRMPPFMRQSNALPLTLAAWQYDLVIQWASAAVRAPALVAAARSPSPAADEPGFAERSAAR
ncbi:MAG: hypothetical protein JOZ58_10355, partial [Acetobacteraceae bacterium]|nr:hypothetical protein [Acetobacteraceae bacterium]